MGYRGTKSRSGTHDQELGRWGQAWLKFLMVLGERNGLRSHRPARVGEKEELGKALVRLLDKEGGEKGHSVAQFQAHGGGIVTQARAPLLPGHALRGLEQCKGGENILPGWPFVRCGPMPY